jgi:hypothetical protein
LKNSYLTAALALFILAEFASVGASFAGDGSNPADRHTGIGIWKAFVPHGVRGEFDSYDPVGLMAGTLIKADCSLNWRDPDTGRLYCFASGTSQVYFQDFPKANLRRAQKGYDRLVGPKAGS